MNNQIEIEDRNGDRIKVSTEREKGLKTGDLIKQYNCDRSECHKAIVVGYNEDGVWTLNERDLQKGVGSGYWHRSDVSRSIKLAKRLPVSDCSESGLKKMLQDFIDKD